MITYEEIKIPLMDNAMNNPLIRTASSLILLFIQLKYTQTVVDVSHLRKKIVTEISEFANQAKAAHCSHHLILAARYCLCTALDEVILLTPWGSKSGWAQQSLLSLIHRETWGGERFFIILEKMAAEPKKNLVLLELLYQLLSLGFEGKYYNEDRMLRAELQYRLYQLIMKYYPEMAIKLSPSINIVDKSIFKTKTKSYFLKFTSSIIGVLLGIGLMFNTLLYWKAKPFLQDLNDINLSHSAFIAPKQLEDNKINTNKNISKNKKHPSAFYHHRHHKYHENIILPPPAWGKLS